MRSRMRMRMGCSIEEEEGWEMAELTEILRWKKKREQEKLLLV